VTPTPIQLTEDESKALRQLSAVTGRSVAELIRSAIDQYLAGKTGDRVERAIRVAGMFSSGSPDASANHDWYLAEAFER
jgi:hypothetical protein